MAPPVVAAVFVIKVADKIYKISKTPAGQKVLDKLIEVGGRLLGKAPKNVSPTTVTAQNVAGIIKNLKKSNVGVGRPSGTSVAKTRKSGLARPKQTSPSSSSRNTSVAGGKRSNSRSMRDITPPTARISNRTGTSRPPTNRVSSRKVEALITAAGELESGEPTKRNYAGPKTGSGRPDRNKNKNTTRVKDPVKKGPMTLTTYLNTEIKKRNSSVTAEKKGSDKYTSISAAKKAGSLYYKNPKTGKIMAAVYKEDLKK